MTYYRKYCLHDPVQSLDPCPGCRTDHLGGALEDDGDPPSYMEACPNCGGCWWCDFDCRCEPEDYEDPEPDPDNGHALPAAA